MKKSFNKIEESSTISNENNNDINLTEQVVTKKSRWNTGIIIVFIIAIALIIGVVFVLKEDMEKHRNQMSSMYGEYEEEEVTSIIGEWYAYNEEEDELIVFHFKNTNKCKIGVEDELEKCSYTYNDDVITIYEGEDGYLDIYSDYLEVSYSLHSSYLELEYSGNKIKFYPSKSKAKKHPITNDSIESNSGNSEKEEDSIDNILNKYSKEDFIKLCENIDYSLLARTPDNYLGKYIHFKGEVIQVQEDPTEKLAVLRVNTKLSDYDYMENYYEDDTVYVIVYNYDMNNRILEEDIIDMYGIYYGIETYETVLGSTVSIPAMVTFYFSID